MKANRKHRWVFPLGLLIYGAVFLLITALGLCRFWDYMEAYERSRPQVALNAYTEDLTPEYICDASAPLIDSIRLQSQESSRRAILNALQQPLTCAKKSSLCTDTKQVYAILSGEQVIGTMEMEQQGQSSFGFTPWVVTKESFDLSYLLTEPICVTVPSDYPVYLWGNKLTEEYITENHVPYPALKEYYSTYSLPYMVTYTAGPFLGEPELLITDPAGTPVNIDKNTDMSQFLDNCTPEEISALRTVTDTFIHRYVDYLSETNNDTMGNYQRLIQHLVPEGELANRMHLALGGLNWVSDRGATVTSIDIHRYVNIGNDRYLCDLTYNVTNKTNTGISQSEYHVQVIYLQTETGFKAETMVNS